MASYLSLESSLSDPTSLLLAYGPLGLMVLGFVTGLIVPGHLAKREADENKRLRALVEDKVLPLVTESTRTLTEVIETLREVERARLERAREAEEWSRRISKNKEVR